MHSNKITPLFLEKRKKKNFPNLFKSSSKNSCIFSYCNTYCGKTKYCKSVFSSNLVQPYVTLKVCKSCPRYLHHSKRKRNSVDVFPIHLRVFVNFCGDVQWVKMKINQWRNVWRPLSFSLHPSRVWKWSVVENLPSVCLQCCVCGVMYVGVVMTALTDVHAPLFHTTTLHSEHVLSGLVNYFYGVFSPCLTVTGNCALSLNKIKKSVYSL